MLSLFAPSLGARAATLFSVPLNVDTPNGNCAWTCDDRVEIPSSQLFMADNFTLLESSTVESISFVGIRTGDPPDLGFTTTLAWRMFTFDESWDNSAGASNTQLGVLVASGDGVLASQEAFLGDNIEFSADIGVGCWRLLAGAPCGYLGCLGRCR